MAMFQTLSFDRYVVILGNGEANAIFGGAASDVFFGLAGDDNLVSGAGEDILFGDPGNNRMAADDGADWLLEGGSAADTMTGGAGDYELIGGDGNDRLDGGAGHDAIDGGPGDDVLIGGVGPDAFAMRPDGGRDVVEDFQAGPGMFDHLVFIGTTAELLDFRAGEDGVTISWNTGASSVLLKGVGLGDLAQDDIIFNEGRQLVRLAEPGNGASAGTQVDQGQGVSAAASGGHVQAGAGGVAAAPPGGSANVQWLYFEGYRVSVGTGGADRIIGDDACDKIWGLAGDDVIDGGDRDNNLFGGAGNDTLAGGSEIDQIDGGDGDDLLAGGGGEDALKGGDGSDRLEAGSGHDMVDGGIGDDMLIGGVGADVFIVGPASGHDIVADFDAGPGAFDHLAFRALRADNLTVQEIGGSVLISWSGGTASITLDGVAAEDLAQDDFMFVEAPDLMPGLIATGRLTEDALA